MPLLHHLKSLASRARRMVLAGGTAFAIGWTGPALAADFADWIESIHQEFWTLVQDRPTIQQSVWMALDGKEQDALLEQLNKDIMAGALKLRAPAKAEESAKKIAEWRRKILDRDSEDWKYGVEDTMTLSEIIDANTPKEGLTRKYGTRYSGMLRQAVQDNPRLIAASVGQIVGGEYDKAAEAVVPQFAASSFGTIVSDILDELRYSDTKVVWDRLMSKGGTLQSIGRALARGDYDAAWSAFTDEYKKEARDYSKAAVASAINNVLSPSGLTGGDAMVDGSINTVPVGELYVALVEAEIAFIEWGRKWIREQSSFGDGECIRRYEASYDQLGSIDAAYEEFDHCIATARYSAMFAFRNGLSELGLGEREATIGFLEDYRRGAGWAPDPLTWLKRKVEMRKAALQKQLVPKLQDANEKLNRQHKLVLRHIAEFLLSNAAYKLDELQLERLQDQLDQMVAELEATLQRLEGDIDRLSKTYAAIPGACSAYEAARPAAVAALELGEAAQAKAHALDGEISGFDAAQCGDLSPSSATGDTFEAWLNEAKARRGSLAGLAAGIVRDVTAICDAPDAIQNAADKQAARDRLDETLELARSGREQTVFELEDESAALEGVVADAEAADPGKWADAEGLQGRLAELRANLRNVRTTYDRANIDLEQAKGQMRREVQRVRALMDGLATDHDFRRETDARTGERTETMFVTETLFDRIEAELKPLERAPVANNVRILMGNLRALREDAVYCDEQLKVSWIETGDLESRDSQGRMHPWSTRSLFLNPPISVLDGGVTELEQRCAALGESGGGPLEFLEAIREEQRLAAIEQASIEDALGRVDLCVSEALIAYDDRWLQPQLVSVPDVTGSSVADATALMGGLGLGLTIGDTAGNEGDTGEALIASQVPAAGEEIDEGETVTVALLPPDEPEEPAAEPTSDALALGREQLSLCDFDGFRQTYDSLPADAPERAALRAVYADEQQARELGKQGRQLYAEGQMATAADTLGQAADLAQCGDTRDTLQASAATARQEAEALAAAEEEERVGGEAVAAAEACDFNKAVAAAQKLEAGHPDRERVKVLLDAEKQARAQIEAGRTAAANGNRADAMAAFEVARASTGCAQTIAVIDQAVTGMPQPSGPAVASSGTGAPDEPAQPPEPQVDTTAVGAEVEALIAACRYEDARARLAQIAGTPDWDRYNRMINADVFLVDVYNDAAAEARANGDPYYVRLQAEEVAYNARCQELVALAEDLYAAADDAIWQEEQWAEEQRAAERQQAMSDLATGLAGILNQMNGRGSSAPPAPASGGGRIPSGNAVGSGSGGRQDAHCQAFQSESEAHSRKVSRLVQEYQGLAGTGASPATVQAKACAMFREMQKGEDIIRRAQAAGCAPPNMPLGYPQQAMAGRC